MKAHFRGILGVAAAAAFCAACLVAAAPAAARNWKKVNFNDSPLYGYPLPHGRDNIVGNLITYTIEPGDDLLDVGRWFGLSAMEISNANKHLDWWLPTPGRKIILPTEHILPDGPRNGIVVNVPELRLYYFAPSSLYPHKHHGKLVFRKVRHPRVVYTFPVGLGRFNWKTPTRTHFMVTAREKNPVWIVPEDIYEEHLERNDGTAVHRIAGGDPANPEGLFRLDLNLPGYAIHGTNDPWGVGMEVSHGCIRLYPEDIERMYHLTKVGTPGYIVYQPIKYGWRGDDLYVEVHPDLYGKYPGLWRLAINLAKQKGILDDIDMHKLEKAVEEKSGVPTYVMPWPQGIVSTASNAN